MNTKGDDSIKFVYKRDYRSIEITEHVNATATDLVESFRMFMLSIGYSPNTVNAALGEEE